MPDISMFYGIIVMMYYFDTDYHHLPHIHIKYGEFTCVISIPDGNLLQGSLPGNKLKLVCLDRIAPGGINGQLGIGYKWKQIV